MSKREETGAVHDRFSVTSRALKERQQKLDCLMDQMDALQDEVDQLNEKYAELKTENARLQGEAHKQDLIKKNKREAELFDRPQTGSSKVDLSELSEEHADIIRSLENRIFDLTHQCEQARQRSENDEAELQVILEEHARLEASHGGPRIKIEQQIRGLKEEVRVKTDELSSVDADIRAVTRLVEDAETAAHGVNMRWAGVNGASNAVADARKRVQSLAQQIANAECRLDDLRYECEEMAAGKKLNLEEYKEKTDRIRKILPWGSPRHVRKTKIPKKSKDDSKAPGPGIVSGSPSNAKAEAETQEGESKKNFDTGLPSERDRLEAELRKVTVSLKDARTENDAMTKRTEKLKRRYEALLPIAKKWRGAVRNQGRDDLPGIDALLKEYKRVSAEATNVDDEQQADLSALDLDIMTLEYNIQSKTSWLEKQMDAFAKKKAELKKQIASQRTEAFNKERELVEAIKKLRIQEAQKKLSRK